MSWWNSNISDLASKALKNAQKQIDKALDIKDQQNALKAASKANTETVGASSNVEAVKDDSKEKSSVWSGWMGETTEDDSSSKSAWSFPWGGNADSSDLDSQTEYLVQEKTAEEIKSEVLKAAKERTKAKSKLFPQKVKSEPPADDVGKLDEAMKTTAVEKTHDTDIILDSKLASSVNKNDDVSDRCKSELEQLPSVITEDRTVFTSDGDNVSNVTDSQVMAEGDSNVAELTVSDANKPSELIYSNYIEASMSRSGFQEVTAESLESSDKCLEQDEIGLESVILGDKTEQMLEHQRECVEIYNSEEESGKLEQIHTEETDLTKPAVLERSKEDTDLDASKNVHVDIQEKTSETYTDSENVNENQDKIICDLSSGDISSSVEFVSDKDIPTAGAIATSEEESYINQACNSDPELIDFDKEREDIEVNDKTLNLNDTNLTTETSNEMTIFELKSDATVDETDFGDKIASEYLAKTEAKISGGSEAGNDESLLIVQQVSGLPDVTKSLCSSDSESSMNKLDSSLDTCASGETVVEQFTNIFNKEDNEKSILAPDQGVYTELTVDVDCDSHGQESDLTDIDANTVSTPSYDFKADMDNEESELERTNISPAHSFVKCMLEDVTEEGKNADDNSDSHSSVEKSEGSRSVYSNQESGDEVDTTTSSDIEIISLPTPNGENRQASPLDPIPLRMALQKSNWRGSPTHRRTDSSDSSNASGGNSELSPGRDCMDYEIQRSHMEHEGHRQDLPALSEEDDNPYHPQKLLKDDPKMEESYDMGSQGQRSPIVTSVSHDPTQIPHDVQTDIDKKLAEMSEILQAREAKLLQQSKDNCDLMETNSILRNQLRQSEETREAEMTDVNELTAEFTQRLTDSEKRLSSAIKEKEAVKKQLQDTQSELAKRAGDVSLKEILAEKEEQIAGLLQEGEKLSKSQLQSNTIIKKLRQKEKDNESTITSQKKKLDSQKEELDHLRNVLDSKEDLEKKQADAIAQLTAAVKRQEQEMVKYKSDWEDATEKSRGLQVALDNSYKEMAELHRNSAALDSKAQGAALSAEMQVREELKLTIEKQQQQHKWAVDSLNMQIEDHRLSMARMEKEYNRREDLLKLEISDLQKQLQEDEARNQELTQGVSLATRPLLRQIENLQSTYNVQSSTWEKVEKNLSDRLSESQNQLAIATEKERMANEHVIDLSSKVTTLETQNTRFRQDRSQMSAELDMLKTKVELSEDAKHNEAAQVEVFKQQMAQEIQELKRQKVMLETELDIEKSKVDQEKKKMLMLQEQLKDAERDLQRSKSRTPVRATPSPVSVSRQDSLAGSIHEQSFTAITQDELDRSFVLSSPNGNKHSLYEALRQSGAANLLENLQSQLKLRDGEISHLQNEIRSLERTRESMAKELVDLSNQNDELEEKVKDMPLLEEQYKDLDQRYNALLQMYGEKVEEADELKLDLQDVKDMYKAQINHLLSQS